MQHQQSAAATGFSKSSDTVQRLLLAAEPALREADPKKLYNATIMFLFRGMNYKAYSARLRKLVGNDRAKLNVRAINEALSTNGYLLKHFKCWLFYVVKNRLGHHDSMVYSRRWRVEEVDAIRVIDLDRFTLAYLKRLAVQYVALPLEKYDRILEDLTVNRELRTWLGKFTSRKHRFVATSQSYTLDDIRCDLLRHGLQGLLNMYPLVKSKLHAQNIIKRTIHNIGINLIHHFTSQKAGRLNRDSNGMFEAKIVSIEAVRETLEMQPVEHDNDLRVDFFRLMERLKNKKRQFVELLAGNYCPKFTAWLRSHGHRVDTNESFQDRVDNESYIRKCLEFLDVRWDAGIKFVRQLKERFQPYRHGAFA